MLDWSDPSRPDARSLATEVEAAIEEQDLQGARSIVYHWLKDWAASLPSAPQRHDLLQPELWRCLGDVVERTSDQYLIELLWQVFDDLPAPPTPPERASGPLPLLGVPILNRADLLQRLLDSLDHPVEILAVVDNSPPESSVGAQLRALRQLGHPLIGSIHIARPFTNLGVAASWNLILSSFPTAPLALLINNDVVLASGVLSAALASLNPNRPQFLQLLPDPNGFSAFLLTALCWDRLGLFDPSFHPAYAEDLDYRDRLRCTPAVEQVDGSFAHAAMAALNPEHSATILSDPELERQNRASFALNRLWYLSHRRLRHDPRGTWRRLWLNQWSAAPAPP
ncbi:glycosyltransferase family 2 protein [Cyanobium sp. NIES-981]|uniref:glycosyltransferase family 2 protein n=1 Tax=Cyanobium sp. NIES-981 TaxID=1851505 RepID=UPI0012F81A50|nr:hypothetical protein [Cyanobium sp. NIES-981]